MLSIRRFSSLIINCSGNGRSLLSPLLPLRQPILRTAEESPEQRFVYRLAFDRVAEISEHCEHHNRQEHDCGTLGYVTTTTHRLATAKGPPAISTGQFIGICACEAFGSEGVNIRAVDGFIEMEESIRDHLFPVSTKLIH